MPFFVIPAKAGIQILREKRGGSGFPITSGMTEKRYYFIHHALVLDNFFDISYIYFTLKAPTKPIESKEITMGSRTFFKAALAAIICSLIFIGPSFSQVPAEAIESAKTFIGTWHSERMGLCAPCTLTIDSFDESGKSIGTLTTYPSGITPLNAALQLKDKNKVVLVLTAPLGSSVEFDVPKKGASRIYGTFTSGSATGLQLGFKRQ